MDCYCSCFRISHSWKGSVLDDWKRTSDEKIGIEDIAAIYRSNMQQQQTYAFPHIVIIDVDVAVVVHESNPHDLVPMHMNNNTKKKN